MAEKLRLRSNGNGDIYLYVEDSTLASFAAGGDNANTVFAMNTSAAVDVMPDGPTANLTFGPGANGNITLRPHGTGDSYFDTGDINLVAGNFVMPATNTAGTEGVITNNGNRIFLAPSTSNLFIGENAGTIPNIVNLDFNIGIGFESMDNLSAGADHNIGIGASTLQDVSGADNVCIGQSSGSSITTADDSVFIGALSGLNLLSGNSNILLGKSAGINYNGAEAANIIIGNDGVLGESNVIRIGNGQSRAFIDGIHAITPAGATQVMVIDALGQMGSGPSSGGAQDFVTDSGTATEVGAIINILGNTEELTTSGAGLTVTHSTTTNFSATANHSWDGAIIEPADVSASSDGATITFSVEASGGGDLDVVFSDGYHLWDTTPADTIALTAGTDTVPVLNYVYFLQSTKALTVSTVSWPATEFAPLALILCPTAALYQTNGSYIFHGWTDHVTAASQEGHIHDINFWIRQQNATWRENVAPTLTITPNGGAADNVIFTSTAGTVLQLHEHTFPAFAGTPDIYVINDSGTAYTIVTDLNALLTDSTGASMSGRYFTLVIWGVISQDGDSKLICNLPSGSYNNSANLLADASQFADFSIPSDFKGSGFLIYEMNLRHQAAASGTWTSVSEIDLRGFIPNQSAGGALATTTEFADSVFRVFDDLDPTKLIALQAASITTANTRTITMCDRDLSLITPTFDTVTADVGDITISSGNLILPYTDATAAEGIIESGGDRIFTVHASSSIGIGLDALGLTESGTLNTAVGGFALSVVTTGHSNVAVGYTAQQQQLTGLRNVAIGRHAMGDATDGDNNVAIGANALSIVNDAAASHNVAVGYQCLDASTTGLNNTAVGFDALGAITTGAYNTALGYSAGASLTVDDNDNIMIRNVGVAADVNTIRIGTQGTGNGQQDTTFVAGIYNVAPSNDGMVIISSAGQLGSQSAFVMPENPAFLAYNSVDDADQTGNGAAATVDFDTEVFDQAGNFAADTFTAPVTGLYQLNAGVSVNDFTAASLINITLVTTARTYLGTQIDPTAAKDSAGAIFLQISVLADMTATDTATVVVTATGEVGDSNDIMGSASPHETYFSGFLAS